MPYIISESDIANAKSCINECNMMNPPCNHGCLCGGLWDVLHGLHQSSNIHSYIFYKLHIMQCINLMYPNLAGIAVSLCMPQCTCYTHCVNSSVTVILPMHAIELLEGSHSLASWPRPAPIRLHESLRATEKVTGPPGNEASHS